jgi:hypothetical protein
MLTDLMRQKERELAGLVNPYMLHLDRPLSEHVADYQSALKAEGVSDKHFSERSRCLLAVIQDNHAKYLPDLTLKTRPVCEQSRCVFLLRRCHAPASSDEPARAALKRSLAA